MLAPICLFAYKRLETLRATVEALKQNFLAPESELFIFSDAAKNETDHTAISHVRAYLKTIVGFKHVIIYEADRNKGLAQSIIDGVSDIVDKYGKVIVLEDDLITSKNFLSFLNRALNRYQADDAVFSISGYSFRIGSVGQQEDAYFINRGWSWGWATWRDRWQKVDWSVQDYSSFRKDKSAQRDFAKGGSDLNAMLRKQMEQGIDSWAIRWFYAQFKVSGLTLYPKLSKVYNNGFDSMATHTNGSSKRYIPSIDRENKVDFLFPDTVAIHPAYQKAFQKKMGVKARVISKIESILIKLFKKP